MCNDYAREIEAGRIIKALREMEDVPPFEWEAGHIPNDLRPQPHIKINDKGLIVRLRERRLAASMIPWAWKTPTRKPVFNFVSEERDFSKSDRVLILATGFYEYTDPKGPKVKLKDQHFFTMQGQDWFWIAGIVKQDAFAMLTTAPGPDMQPYHDRQIVVLRPEAGMGWLKLDMPEAEILKAPPKGTLQAKTLRIDGVEVS
jgi:putative SOS response-associated peptidase YedK